MARPKWYRSLGFKIIVSQDKDLSQIPGLHLNPRKLDEGIVEIAAKQGDRTFWFQELTGDVPDNYSGCPKIGPGKATKLLDSGQPEEYPVLVLAAFEKAGLSIAEAAVQINVARILQYQQYDFKKKEPILWKI